MPERMLEGVLGRGEGRVTPWALTPTGISAAAAVMALLEDSSMWSAQALSLGIVGLLNVLGINSIRCGSGISNLIGGVTIIFSGALAAGHMIDSWNRMNPKAGDAAGEVMEAALAPMGASVSRKIQSVNVGTKKVQWQSKVAYVQDANKGQILRRKNRV